MPTDSMPSELPDDLVQVFRKYRSLGAAVKANDEDATRKIVAHLRTSEDRSDEELVEDLSHILLLSAGTLGVSMAKLLLELGATVGMLEKDNNAVQAAVVGKNGALAAFLIEQGAVDASAPARDGSTLLMLALQSEQFDLADKLVELGAPLDATTLVMTGGQTALHLAAANVSFQGVVWLMEKGANPTILNTEGRLACELIPSLDESSKGEGWDLDALYESLEDYREAFGSGVPFEIPLRLREMAFLESTPMSAMEAQMNAMKGMQDAQKKHEEESVVPVKKKKIGF